MTQPDHAQTRKVQGIRDYTEMGSVYSSDIAEAFVGGNWEVVNHSRNTLVLARNRKAWGF